MSNKFQIISKYDKPDAPQEMGEPPRFCPYILCRTAENQVRARCALRWQAEKIGGLPGGKPPSFFEKRLHEPFEPLGAVSFAGFFLCERILQQVIPLFADREHGDTENRNQENGGRDDG